MAEFEEKVKVQAKKAKASAKKAKKAIVKHSKKAYGACKKGWAKLRQSIKDLKEKNKRTEYLVCMGIFMQSANMNSASLTHATRGCVASATGDTSGIATCNDALVMQSGVAGQTSALPLRVAFQAR
ncbi:hypothetical protein D0Y65_001290 [Glycine soja]|uniref:Uncharacterized protein n=1 Tax=Glycine soja TaxID=3848 RepID=A0A445M2G3_GLYSO|nr:hypothetical protein D0Y65_001290 [Glycine soja]